MNPAQLLAQFDRIGEAPEAVPCLRRFILDLAVQGKLVEQDPRDEPASEILKRMQEERERFSTNSTVRKNKIDGRVDFDEMPFELPKSWVFTSLGEVSRYGLPDKVNSSKEIATNTWVLDLEDIEKDSSRLVERVVSLSRPFKKAQKHDSKKVMYFSENFAPI